MSRASLDAQKGAVGTLWAARHETEVVNFGNGAPVVTRWRVDGTGPITRRLAPGHSPLVYSPDGTKLTVLVPPSIPNALDTHSSARADAEVLDARSGKRLDDIDKLALPFWLDNTAARWCDDFRERGRGDGYDLAKSASPPRGPRCRRPICAAGSMPA